MKCKYIRLPIVAVVAFAILSTSCTITTTRNIYYTSTTNPQVETDSTAFRLNSELQPPKSNDGQR